MTMTSTSERKWREASRAITEMERRETSVLYFRYDHQTDPASGRRDYKEISIIVPTAMLIEKLKEEVAQHKAAYVKELRDKADQIERRG